MDIIKTSIAPVHLGAYRFHTILLGKAVCALSDLDLHFTMEAVKRRLNDYRFEDREIETQTERLERLMNKMYDVGAQTLTDMPRAPSPSNDRMSDFVSRKLELEKEIGEKVIKHQEQRAHIEMIVKNLPKPDQRAVIRVRVIDRMEWPDVTDILYGGNSDFLDKEETYSRRTFRIFNDAICGMAKYILKTGDNFCDD